MATLLTKTEVLLIGMHKMVNYSTVHSSQITQESMVPLYVGNQRLPVVAVKITHSNITMRA